MCLLWNMGVLCHVLKEDTFDVSDVDVSLHAVLSWSSVSVLDLECMLRSLHSDNEMLMAFNLLNNASMKALPSMNITLVVTGLLCLVELCRVVKWGHRRKPFMLGVYLNTCLMSVIWKFKYYLSNVHRLLMLGMNEVCFVFAEFCRKVTLYNGRMSFKI